MMSLVEMSPKVHFSTTSLDSIDKPDDQMTPSRESFASHEVSKGNAMAQKIIVVTRSFVAIIIDLFSSDYKYHSCVSLRQSHNSTF
jgi:hypothetical protein